MAGSLQVPACPRVLAAGFDYERAAGLLDSAIELVERLSPPAEHVEMLLEWADARLVCGRLVDARAAYERASAAAQAAADPLAQARAALGLGGVWVDEHRGQVDRTRVLELQRSALDGLPPADTGLRARLEVRLAAEAVYDGAPVGPVFETLAVARQLDDPGALAEALSLSHHALLAPEHLADRLTIADDLIRVATAAGDSLRVLFGLLWKAVDQFHGGDVAAVRTLDELRRPRRRRRVPHRLVHGLRDRRDADHPRGSPRSTRRPPPTTASGSASISATPMRPATTESTC